MSKNVENIKHLCLLFFFCLLWNAILSRGIKLNRRTNPPIRTTLHYKVLLCKLVPEMVPTDRLVFSFSFFLSLFFSSDIMTSSLLAHRWMRNQRPDVSAQDGCASCKVLLKKLLHLLSQGAPSLISDLLAGVTTCRFTLCTAHFENRRRTWKQRKVRYVSRVPDQPTSDFHNTELPAD